MENKLTEKYIKTLDSLIDRALDLNTSIKKQEKELEKYKMMIAIIPGVFLSILMLVISVFFLYNQDVIASTNLITKMISIIFLSLSFVFVFIPILKYKKFNTDILKKSLSLDIAELHDLLAYIDEYKKIIHNTLRNNMFNDEKPYNNEEIIAALEQADFRLRYISFSHR